jgi:ArsR family transcriptional regulator, cadmium/lead-responsive transcriptional repressor
VPTVEDERLWAAIGDPSRLQVLDLLLARGEATQSALARELPVSRQAVAKHLAVLDRAGLVERRRGGREVLFSVRPARLDDATQQLARVAERWDRRLSAIKRLAEQAHAAAIAGGDQARDA